MKKILSLLVLSAVSFCFFTSCSTEAGSPEPADTNTQAATSTTASSEIISTTTTAEETIETTTEPPVIEEIEHLEVMPVERYSALVKHKVTSYVCLCMLINPHSKYPLKEMNISTALLTNRSTLDNPTPSSTFIFDWGFYPSAFVNNLPDMYFASFIDANDLTGCKPSELYENIDNSIPVMVYITEELQEPYVFKEYEGEVLMEPKECVILVGYNDTHVVVWSPLKEDYVTYERALFEQRFEEMGSMALTVTAKA